MAQPADPPTPEPLVPFPRRHQRQLAAFNRLLVREAIRQAVDRAGATPTPAVEAHVVTLYVRAAARHGERHFRTADLRALTAGLPPAVPPGAVMEALILLDPEVLRHVRTELQSRRTQRGRRTRDLRAEQRRLARLSLAPYAVLDAELRALARTGRREAVTERLVQRLTAPKLWVGLTDEMRQLVDVFQQAGLTRWPACKHTAQILQRWHYDIPKDELTPRRIYDRLRHRPKPTASA